LNYSFSLEFPNTARASLVGLNDPLNSTSICKFSVEVQKPELIHRVLSRNCEPEEIGIEIDGCADGADRVRQRWIRSHAGAIVRQSMR
jgi:hypothetical protein